MAKSQEVLEELFPGTVTVDGTSYAAATSPLRNASRYDDGGELDELDVVVRVAKGNLGAPWEVGTLLSYQDRDANVPKEMRVLEQSADEGAWVFRCSAAVKA
jgi:hypothetical protein